jgi:hypothetical protein
MIFALIIAIGIPLAFLLLVRRWDLYASGSFAAVLLCMGGGVAAFLAAGQLNSALLPLVGYALIITLVAPILEEILKSLLLIYFVQQPDFTYFVDGAIYCCGGEYPLSESSADDGGHRCEYYVGRDPSLFHFADARQRQCIGRGGVGAFSLWPRPHAPCCAALGLGCRNGAPSRL